MKKGTTYTKPLSNPGPKTGRLYGAVFSAVRAKIRSMDRFSRADCGIVPRDSFGVALSKLRARGEIEVIGRNGRQFVYRKAARFL